MLSASCPSCGAPIRFAHAVAAATVCERCRSTVVNDGAHLALAGKASVFPRELSPILLGARGKVGGRGFLVAGVVRKERERVRWNEWFLIFDDGGQGWLGEGNGELTVFDRHERVPLPPEVAAARPTDKLRLHGQVWTVTENDTAAVVAADGDLPFGATDGAQSRYLDLRLGDGRSAATLDLGFDPPALFTGRLTALKDLGLDRIRPFTGWTDPELQAAMQGQPEITATRSVTCPSCTAPLTLHGGGSASITCRFCGAITRLVDAVPDRVVDRLAPQKDWEPTLPLGSRGKLDGIEWEVIGVMERYVVSYGAKYSWTEHFLFNPYHGYRWLAEDHGTRHWNLIERLPDLPERRSSSIVKHAGHGYRVFQSGEAHVARVMGEFTWEVHAGDTALTADYVDPPWMLSTEVERNEMVATLGRFVDALEIADAFPDAKPFRPRGVAPNQPNPMDQRGTVAGFAVGAVLFCLAALALFVVQELTSADALLASHQHTLEGQEISRWVSPPFEVPEALRTTLTVTLASNLDPEHAVVHLNLLNQTDGTAWHVAAGRTAGTGRVSNPTPGRYVAVVEVASDAGAAQLGRNVKLDVRQDQPWFLPVVLTFLVGLAGPVAWLGARSLFEKRRWQNSDFAE